MTSERDVLDVFERANPVPDPDAVVVEPDPSRFLADLLGRDPTEIRVDSDGRRPTAGTRRWLLPAVAATVAVGVVGLAAVVRNDSTSEAPAATTPSDTSPSTTTVPTPTTQAEEITPPPATAPPGQLSDDVQVVESGATYASPVGDITWTRIDGDASSLPGWINFESDGSFYGADDDGTNWVSDDGIAWAETDPLPGERGSYVNVGDDVWTVISSRPGRLGRWNGESFEPVDLSEIESPDAPPGLRAVEEFVRLEPLGDTLIVTAVTRFGLDPANDAMEYGDDVDMDDVGILWIDDTSYQVVMTSTGTATNFGPEFTLSADSADPDVASISDPDSNIVGRVGPWPGLDAGQLIERLRHGGVAQSQTFIFGDNGLETLQNLPSGLRGVTRVGDVVLAVSGDGQPGSSFSLWRTEDLSTWEPVTIPVQEPGTIRWVSLAGNGTDAILDLQIDPPEHGEVWITDDGTTWRPTNAPRIWSDVVVATDFGWVRDDEPWAGGKVWVSRDGIDWQGFGLEFDPGLNGGWTRSFALATKIFVIHQDGTDRTLWVGEVQTG